MEKVIGVGVMIKTKKGTYLFQERDNNTSKNPGCIAPFGGGIEKGEDVYQCAKRELFEELNLNLNTNDLEILSLFNSRNVPKAYIQMFLVKEIEASTLTLQEGKGIVEFSLKDALKNQRVTEFTKEVLSMIEEF